MPLVQAKCTVCGANIEVDSASEAAVCKHCGAAFIVEKAINNYKVTNEIRDSVVNIYSDSNSADKLIKNGETYVKLGDYKAGLTAYEKATQEHPDDWRGWWGRVICLTEDGRYYYNDYNNDSDVTLMYIRAARLAPEDEFKDCKKWYDEYRGQVSQTKDNKYRRVAKEGVDREVKWLKQHLNDSISQLGETQKNIFELQSNLVGRVNNTLRRIVGYALVVLGAVAILYKGIGSLFSITSETAIGPLLWPYVLLGIILIISGLVEIEGNVNYKKIAVASTLLKDLRSARSSVGDCKREIEGQEKVLAREGLRGEIEERLYQEMASPKV